jgi:putative SOS response-associated peptidase YedK
VETLEELLAPRYNIAPSQIVPVIRSPQSGADLREMAGCKWGLIPYWAKDPKIGNNLINAKAETISEKPSFKHAFAKRRCLIPADGFYEWKSDEVGSRVPQWISRRDRASFAFAGLWAALPTRDQSQVLHSCTIVTCAPNGLISPIHDRMPVILAPDSEAAWLDPGLEPEELLALLAPAPDDLLSVRAVSDAVNDVRQDGAHLIDPREEQAALFDP